MTLAASGTMSIGGSTSTRSINLELGRAAGATSSLGETALRNLAGVPSGAISMSNFYGKSATTFSLSALSAGVSDTQVAPDTATITVRLKRNGDLDVVTLFGTDFYDWGSPNATTLGDGYEARLTKNSGTNPTGSALGTWLALSSQRDWTLQQVGVGSVTANVTLEIRITSGSVVASQTFDMTATNV